MKKALFVWGGWDGHEPKQTADIFAAIMASEGFEVQISDTLDAFVDRDNMMSLDLVVPAWTMGSITGEQEAGLLSAVRSGVGIARLARRNGRCISAKCRCRFHGRRPMGGAPRREYRLRGKYHPA